MGQGRVTAHWEDRGLSEGAGVPVGLDDQVSPRVHLKAGGPGLLLRLRWTVLGEPRLGLGRGLPGERDSGVTAPRRPSVSETGR